MELSEREDGGLLRGFSAFTTRVVFLDGPSGVIVFLAWSALRIVRGVDTT